jgi:hypothetical protein
MPSSDPSDPVPAHPAQAPLSGAEPVELGYAYEPLERFGEGLTTRRPWNTQALAAVEQLNGRVAMLGFMAAVLGEALTGEGVVGQLLAMLRWLLGGTIA